MGTRSQNIQLFIFKWKSYYTMPRWHFLDTEIAMLTLYSTGAFQEDLCCAGLNIEFDCTMQYLYDPQHSAALNIVTVFSAPTQRRMHSKIGTWRPSIRWVITLYLKIIETRSIVAIARAHTIYTYWFSYSMRCLILVNLCLEFDYLGESECISSRIEIDGRLEFEE